MANLDRTVDLVEVGPRDGLQSEPTTLEPRVRAELVARLIAAGARRIEVASFVHPGVVPQMAGAEDVCALLDERSDVSYIGLVLNQRGLDRAVRTPIDEINFVVAAGEGYSEANFRRDVEGTMREVETMLPAAIALGFPCSLTISVAFGDPFDGPVAPEVVADLAERGVAAGAQEIALGDTIGAAVPTDVTHLAERLSDSIPGTRLRCHFHNTRNTGYANAVAALDAGVRVLDASVGGFGGSPFAPGAGGNIATEDLAHMLHRMGVSIPIEIAATTAVAEWLGAQLGAEPQSMLGRSGPFPR